VGTTIIKPDRDVDWYVMWYSVPEFPIAWGPLDEFKARVKALPNDHTPELSGRIERADRNGTSALFPGAGPLAYSWEARKGGHWDTVIVEQKGVLRIGQFPEFCAVVDAGGDWEALLEPLERD
jgi:hypothetical protein